MPPSSTSVSSNTANTNHTERQPYISSQVVITIGQIASEPNSHGTVASVMKTRSESHPRTTTELQHPDDCIARNRLTDILSSGNLDKAGTKGTISSVTDISYSSDGTEAYTDEDRQPYYHLDEYTNHGISADDFLRMALGMNEDEYKDIKGRISSITKIITDSDAYRAQLETIKNVAVVSVDSDSSAEVKETGMHQSFAKMGNMILRELENDIPDEDRKIRLFCNRGHQVERNQRKGPVIRPDVVLVPKTVRKRCSVSKHIHIREILSLFSFKISKNFEGASMDTGGIDESVSEEGSQVSSTVSATSSNKMAVIGEKRKAGQHAAGRPKKVLRREEESSANPSSMDWDNSDPHGRQKLACYAAAAMSDRGDRKFVYGVRVNACKMTLAFYHRTGIVEADAFDVCEHPEYLALFLHLFQRDPSTYGFITMRGYCDPFDMMKEGPAMRMHIKDKLVEKNEEYEANGVHDDLKTDKQEAAEYCIVGRGGSVCKAVFPSHKSVPDMAVKFSWQPTSHGHEIENMKIARRCIPNSVAETYGHATVQDDSPFEALRNACSHPQESYTENTFRILVMKHYRRLSEVEDMDIFWELTRQLIICLHKLYVEQNLLHRDISIWNLAWEMAGDKPLIMILDFELATVVSDKVRFNEVRIGTVPFMAREVLRGFKSGYKHSLNHDLESVYYIVIWRLAVFLGYGPFNFDGKFSDPLRMWREGSYENMCRAKEDHMKLCPSFNMFDSSETSEEVKDAIYVICAVRRAYYVRESRIEEYEKVMGLKAAADIEAVRDQAYKDGLSKDERQRAVNNKTKEIELESERRKAVNAISFKEWMISAEFIDPEHIDCDCGCCYDDLAKANSPSKE